MREEGRDEGNILMTSGGLEKIARGPIKGQGIELRLSPD